MTLRAPSRRSPVPGKRARPKATNRKRRNGKRHYKHHEVKRSAAQVMREARAEARDIGKIPPVMRPDRRKACRLNLERFLLTYLPRRFYLPFSDDHRKLIKKLEGAVLRGELYAEGVYRGFGKTSIDEGAALWAGLYAHREFVPIISATEVAGAEIIESIKGELEDNDILAEDFPEVCVPARALEGIAHRCAGQLCEGVPTGIEWKVYSVRFPTIPGSVSSGVTILATGITGRIRGMKYRAPDGSVRRPDFVILDDPQTDASAKSPSQCDYLERLINGAILGLAGPDKRISGVMACTVIRKGDLSFRFLDRERRPEWQGDTIPLVKRFAARHDDLWLRDYAEIRRRNYSDTDGGRERAEKEATAFYEKNREAMDAWATVSWEGKRLPGEVSAIQNAYNLLIDRGEAAFMAEMQCSPLDEFEGIDPPLEPRDILAKVGNLERYTVEHGTTTVVSFVDCGQQSNVHWATCWFGDGFTGGVLDHGVQKVPRGKHGKEASLTAALSEVVAAIAGRSYPLAGGGAARLGLCLVDSGWLARTVYAFCRNSPHANILAPSKGQGGEMELRAPKTCPRNSQGDGWYQYVTLARDARLLVYDTDYWKAFVEERLRTPAGGRGNLSLWRAERAEEHRKFAEHVTAERAKPKTTKRGDVFQKYECLPGRPNHFWDCLVGCHVGAARLGVRLDGTEAPKPKVVVQYRPAGGVAGGGSNGGGWKIGR